jgi:predicted metal-dependent hydrolase
VTRPRRFDREIDPGPVQIQARKVAFDVTESPLHWIPGHPVASHMVSLLNVVLPAAERWFVATFSEALPLVKDERLAEDMRGFIGQEAVHADTHERALHEFMERQGVDPRPILDQVEYIVGKVLGAEHLCRPEAAVQSPLRAPLADRGDRALHRSARRLRPQQRLG